MSTQCQTIDKLKSQKKRLGIVDPQKETTKLWYNFEKIRGGRRSFVVMTKPGEFLIRLQAVRFKTNVFYGWSTFLK